MPNTKDYAARYYRENRERFREHYRRRVAANKALVAIYKALPCADCNQNFPPCCMEFDHVEDHPTKKIRMCIGSMVGSQGIEAVKNEIDKCEVVCANCHAIRTDRRGQNKRGGCGDGSGWSGNRNRREALKRLEP